MRALVIDDDPAIAEMVALALTLEGFDVTIAHNGEDGVLAALHDRPEVIVLDVMMPEVDGWQVAGKLRECVELEDIPIVFCTALGDDESMWQGWRSGAASYVTKPFEPSHLVAEVVRAARG